MDVAPRTVIDHPQAIADQLSKSSGIEVRGNTSILGMGLERVFRGIEPDRLEWGTSEQSAREALIDLLDHSASSLSWRFVCQASTDPQDRFCVLSITPIQLTIATRDGSSEPRMLQFERCAKCPAPPPRQLGQ